MKIVHYPDIDYVSIDFKKEVEAKAILKEGIIVRLDKKGHVLGIDITNSSHFFSKDEELTMKEACELLGISQSTLKRRIKQGRIKYVRPNGKSLRFKKADLLETAS